MTAQLETVQLKPKSKTSKSVGIRLPIDLAATYKAAADLEGKDLSDFLRDKIYLADSIQEGKPENKTPNNELFELLSKVMAEQEQIKDLFFGTNKDTGEKIEWSKQSYKGLQEIYKEVLLLRSEIEGAKTEKVNLEEMITLNKGIMETVNNNLVGIKDNLEQQSMAKIENSSGTLFDIQGKVNKIKEKIDAELSRKITALNNWRKGLIFGIPVLLLGIVIGGFGLKSCEAFWNSEFLGNEPRFMSVLPSDKEKAKESDGKSINQTTSKQVKPSSKPGKTGGK